MDNKNMKEDILTRLRPLIGAKLNQSGRAGDVVWIQFGDIQTVLRSGRARKTAQYALNIQCTWRITDSKKILVASKDRYKPSTLFKGDIADFKWDILGMNSLDQKLNEHINLLSNKLTVKAIEADNFGGLLIYFQNGYQLDVFPDESTNEEFWRLLMREENSHLVVSGSGIDII